MAPFNLKVQRKVTYIVFFINQFLNALSERFSITVKAAMPAFESVPANINAFSTAAQRALAFCLSGRAGEFSRMKIV